jgi:hypothetical protein
MTNEQYKALTTSANSAAEFDSKYSKLIQDAIGQEPTLYNLIPKVRAPQARAKGFEFSGNTVGWRMRSATNTTVGSIAETGALVGSGNQTIQALYEGWSIYKVEVGVSDLMQAASETGVGGVLGDAWQYELTRATEDLIEDIDTGIFAGNGTTATEIFGLEQICDDGTNTTTVYNKTRTAAAANNYLDAYLDSNSTTARDVNNPDLNELINNAKKYRGKIDLLATKVDQASNIVELNEPKVRYTPVDLNFGFKDQVQVPQYKGIPIYADEHCPATGGNGGNVYGLDRRFLALCLLQDFTVKSQGRVNLSEDRVIEWMGAHVCNHFRPQGRITYLN